MNDGPDPPTSADAAPRAEIVRARRRVWSWAWLVPLGALAIVAALLYQVRAERGPSITIRFQNGEGLQAGDPVTFRGVRIGEVRGITLDPDLSGIMVRADLSPDAAPIATQGARFWIVRPELSLTRISGLDTLLGPRYIAAEPGAGPPAADFTGVNAAPDEADPAQPDRFQIVIRAARLGSLGIGSAITFRGVKVGVITGYQLSADARTVELTGAVDPPFHNLVRTNSRFWDAGRIGLDFGLLSGVTVKAGSLETLVAGGIGFATPDKPGDPVQPGHRFILEPKPDDDWLQWSPDLSIQPGDPPPP